jgi:GNAT superfamily N-acetyltransferase
VETWDAGPDDAEVVAGLLHDFNTEFDTPTPGVEVLTSRLRDLLATPGTAAILAGRPAVAVALVTFRTNVWYEGPVALLDELYVRPDLRDQGIGTAIIGRLFELAHERSAGLIEINVDEGDVDTQRFYERHGFRTTEVGSDERAFYYWQERA